MGSIIINGFQIFFLTENDRFPEPHRNSPQMFAIREDEEHQHWLYAWYNQRWPLASEAPFKTQGLAFEAAIAFDTIGLHRYLERNN